MTKLLYYCQVMKKWLSYILMAAFIISIFDILDVSDVKLGNREIFSTENAYADNDYDDLNDNSFHYSSVSAFEIRATHFELVFEVVDTAQPIDRNKKSPAYPFSPVDLYRPPIA